MSAATAPHRQAHTPPVGTGPLHNALEASRDLTRLHAFCRSIGCAPGDVSSDGGKSLDIMRVFDAMRRRGYSISQPSRPQTQLRKGFTAWVVNVKLPDGPACQLGFYTPNTS